MNVSTTIDWGLLGRQVLRVARFEWLKMVSSRRWLGGVIAIGAPLVLMGIALIRGAADVLAGVGGQHGLRRHVPDVHTCAWPSSSLRQTRFRGSTEAR